MFLGLFIIKSGNKTDKDLLQQTTSETESVTNVTNTKSNRTSENDKEL
jgi:hypothetical protein